MEIIFCRCGGTEVILMVPHLLFRTIFLAGSAPSIPAENAVPHRCRGAEVPTSVIYNSVTCNMSKMLTKA